MKRPLNIFYFIGASHDFVEEIFDTVLAIYYVQTVGMNPLQLVLMGTMLEIGYLLFEVPTGIVADTYSRKWSVVIAYFLLGIGLFMQAIFPVVTIIAFFALVRAIGYTFESGALEAWLADEIGADKLGPALLRRNQIQTIAGILGIVVGVLLGAYSLTLPMYLGGFFLCGVAVYLIFVMPETGFVGVSAETSPLAAMRETLTSAFTFARVTGIITFFIILEFFYGSFSEGLDRLWEAQFLANFTFPPWFNQDAVVWFGVMRITLALVNIVGTEVVVRRLDMNNKRQLTWFLLIMHLIIIVSMATFGIASQFWIAAVAFVVVNATRRVLKPVIRAWWNNNIPSAQRATVLSMIGQSNAIGQMAGGPFVGWIATVRSLRVAMVLSAMFLTPSIPLFGRYLKKQQSEHPK